MEDLLQLSKIYFYKPLAARILVLFIQFIRQSADVPGAGDMGEERS